MTSTKTAQDLLPGGLGPPTAALQDRIDRRLLVGALLIGSFFLAPFGVVSIVRTIRLIREAERAGHVLRPHAITAIAFVCLLDFSMNYLIWSMDFFPTHDSPVVQTLVNGVARLWDGAYYLGYNHTSLGGTPMSGEKSWQVAGILMLYPMRLAAGWGFLKMKRWGYQFFLVTAWLYVFFWVGYATNFTLTFPYRVNYTAWGMIGWWFIDLMYFTPFLLIPYLHTVNRELWGD